MQIQVSAVDLAEQLVRDFIANIDQKVVSDLAIPPTNIREYDAKVLLFRTAAVIMAVHEAESQLPAFGRVQEEMEKLIYDGGRIRENLTKSEDIKAAMKSLDALLQSGKPASWSIDWLKDICPDESNPIVLYLFGGFWITFLKCAQDTLANFDPR